MEIQVHIPNREFVHYYVLMVTNAIIYTEQNQLLQELDAFLLTPIRGGNQSQSPVAFQVQQECNSDLLVESQDWKQQKSLKDYLALLQLKGIIRELQLIMG